MTLARGRPATATQGEAMTIPVFAVIVFLLLFSPPCAQAADVRLWRLDCGAIQVNDLDLFSDTFRYAGRQKTLANSCYLIAHNGQYMLWDAGLPENLLHAPLGQGPMSASLDKTIAQQLQSLGVAPESVAILGLSHNHFDHVGQASAFPQAKLLLGKADYAALAADPPPFGVDAKPLEAWLRGKGTVETVAGDKDVFGDGSVVMLAMPGHTPGSYALLVRLPMTGPVLLGGDVGIFEEQLATREVPSFNADRAQSLASMQRLLDIAKALHAKLVIQHDAEAIGLLPAFPASAQ
jgi:glyoxylase-like metal-dependent hydrolase (beta-lactamase superfamily II)